MRILIIGTGYVGLVSGACFAEIGNDVACFDIDNQKIKLLQSGKVPFYEPGIEELVKKNIALNKLRFEINLSQDINSADIVFICIGTPPKENGQADLQNIYQTAEQIGKILKNYVLIVTKSTVPVGTSKKIKKIINNYYKSEFDVASCPEFLREGLAISDFMKPDRIIIGTESEKAKDLLLRIYEKIDCPKLICDLATSEMIKYAANAFLATKISFINEIANICENVGADVERVSEGIGLDKRIGKYFLKAGIGYGGSCFPKDIRALHHFAGQAGYPFQLLKAVVEVNNQQRWLFYKKIKEALACLENKIIGIWGLAFKPDTDDIRESISLDIVEKLVEDGALVRVYDPQATQNAKKILGNKIQYCLNAEDAIENADCLVLLTDWGEFKQANFRNIKNKMRFPLIIDGRNALNSQMIKEYGFRYISIGRSQFRS